MRANRCNFEPVSQCSLWAEPIREQLLNWQSVSISLSPFSPFLFLSLSVCWRFLWEVLGTSRRPEGEVKVRLVVLPSRWDFTKVLCLKQPQSVTVKHHPWVARSSLISMKSLLALKSVAAAGAGLCGLDPRTSPECVTFLTLRLPFQETVGQVEIKALSQLYRWAS